MIKEKKTKQLTFRLTEKEFNYLEKASFAVGSTPSNLIRQLIQISINSAIKAEELNNGVKKEVKSIEV